MPKGQINKGMQQTFYKPAWNHQPTDTVRVPAIFKDAVLSYARQLDTPLEEQPHDSGFIELLEEIRDRYLVTIPPKRRAEVSKLLNSFIKYADKPQ